jgi:hypothetical protein
MSYMLEYHKSKDTIADSKKERQQLIATHLAKYLGGFPDDVRAKLAKVIADDQDAAYGTTEYIVKDVQPDDAHAWPGSLLVEQAFDESWTRVTLATQDEAADAKKQIALKYEERRVAEAV